LRYPEKDNKVMETIILEIKGMSCGHCVGSVERSLEGIDGVESVNVDLKAGEATVAGTNLAPESLIKAVNEEGYEAKVKES
jgi:copper chaperone CopZ